VVDVADHDDAKLKEIVGVSGELPVFDRRLLRSLQWASNHYVAPTSVVLAKATPPNLPSRPEPTSSSTAIGDASDHPLAAVARDSATGRRRPTTAIVGPWQDMSWLSGLGSVLGARRSAAIITATGAEASAVAAAARGRWGDRVVEVPTEDDREVTAAWSATQVEGVIAIGPPRLAMWQVAGLALVVVLEEGRRAMKERQTPTIHVRDMIRTRSLVEGFNAVFIGPTPSVELLAGGAATLHPGRRAWGQVEIVDRSDEPPGAGLLADRVVRALRALSKQPGERAFLLTAPRMVDAVVEEAGLRLGRGAAGVHPEGVVASVGSERDLAGLEPVRLAVAVNIDMMPGLAGYRGEEEALRQLARLAGATKSRGRTMAQTKEPSSRLAATLRSGNPMPYLEGVLVERAKAGMPPAREMLAVEVRGEVPEGIADEMRSFDRVEIYGPADVEDGLRWLLIGDLTTVRAELRTRVGHWRERGATVRIDADPIDL
jgi:primosomal protein N'